MELAKILTRHVFKAHLFFYFSCQLFEKIVIIAKDSSNVFEGAKSMCNDATDILEEQKSHFVLFPLLSNQDMEESLKKTCKKPKELIEPRQGRHRLEHGASAAGCVCNALCLPFVSM